MNRQRQERIHKHLDLPVKFLNENIEHYEVAKPRNDQESERLLTLRPGTAVLEYQCKGLGIAGLAFKLAKTPDAIDFMTYVLSTSTVNTSWYTFARNAEENVMRRVLNLTDLTASQPEYRRSTEDLRYEAAFMLGEAAILTEQTAKAFQYRDTPNEFERLRMKTGRLTGNAAITMFCAERGDLIIDAGGMGPADTQQLVRKDGLALLEKAQNSHNEFGIHASVAQLADPYSNVSVYWHKYAPNDALFALEQAYALKEVA